MHSNTADSRTIHRRSYRSTPQLTRIDGRTAIAKRHRVVTKQICETLHPRRRLTMAERDVLARCAWLQVLSEQAAKRALLGEIDVLSAVRANSLAHRALRELRNSVVLNEDDA
jgi:hypothetical protein